MNHKHAPFITFEGGEGSGKTTQIHILFKELLKRGVDVIHYREPGGTRGAEIIRKLLVRGAKKKWTPTAEALLMSAARAELVEKRIVPQLKQGTWVLCDRYTDSTIAYQGFGHNLGYKPIEALNRFTVGVLIPDLTFVFQIAPELGLSRTTQREGDENRFEKFDLPFHRRVAEGYAEILQQNPDRCVPINGLLDVSMISDNILQTVKQRFGIKKYNHNNNHNNHKK